MEIAPIGVTKLYPTQRAWRCFGNDEMWGFLDHVCIKWNKYRSTIFITKVNGRWELGHCDDHQQWKKITYYTYITHDTKCTLTFVMSQPPSYPQFLMNECAQFKSPSLLSHSPFIYHQGSILMVEEFGWVRV